MAVSKCRVSKVPVDFLTKLLLYVNLLSVDLKVGRPAWALMGPHVKSVLGKA